LKKNFSFKQGDFEKALKDVFIQMDRSLLTESVKKELAKITAKTGGMSADQVDKDQIPFNAGSTGVVALITRSEIYVANTGDSRAVLAVKGKTEAMSFDHKPDLPEERRRIERNNMEVKDERVQGNLAVSRAFGDCEYKDKNNPPEHNAVTVVPDIKV